MALSSQTIDTLIITVFEILKALQRSNNGEPITDEDLKLDTWDEIKEKLKKEGKI